MISSKTRRDTVTQEGQVFDSRSHSRLDESQTLPIYSFVLLSLPKCIWSPQPQAYLGAQRGPKESRLKDYGCWENCQVHTGRAVYVALPQAAFPGHRARATEREPRGVTLPPPHAGATREKG